MAKIGGMTKAIVIFAISFVLLSATANASTILSSDRGPASVHTSVPEPGTSLILGLGLIGLAFIARRRAT